MPVVLTAPMDTVCALHAGALPIYRYCHTLENGKATCLMEAL